MCDLHAINEALVEMNRENEVSRTSCVVSLGTGLAPITTVETVNVSDSYLDLPESVKGKFL